MTTLDQSFNLFGVAQVAVFIRADEGARDLTLGDDDEKGARRPQRSVEDFMRLVKPLAGHFSEDAPGSSSKQIIDAVEEARDLNRKKRERERTRSTGGGATAMALAKMVPEMRTRAAAKPTAYPSLNALVGHVTPEGYAQLKQATDQVVDVLPINPLELIQSEDGPIANEVPVGTTWGIKRLKIDELRQEEGVDGKGVLVGHIDTGVEASHPALIDAIAHFGFFNLLGSLDETDTARDSDAKGHGTHTAATIAGRMVDGVDIGVAPGCQLASACVVNGGNTTKRILSGLQWMLDRGVRVINMSVGDPDYQEAWVLIFETIRARNVLPVVAIGNSGPSTARCPGTFSSACSVGSFDQRNWVAEKSSSLWMASQKRWVPALVGPGVQVVSASHLGGYISKSGTSMATPHISGLAALLMQGYPEAKASQVEEAILSSCSIPPDMVSTRCGDRGAPDAVQAMAILKTMVAR